MGDLDLPVGTKDRVSERDLEPHEHIGPGPGAGLARSPETSPEKVEYVAKTTEIRGKTTATATTGVRTPGGLGVGLVPEMVVLGAFLRVGEDPIRLVDRLEPLFSTRFLADIGVILPGQAAVGFLHLLFIGIPWYPEDIVVVLKTILLSFMV
jgi:hypothetical protein